MQRLLYRVLDCKIIQVCLLLFFALQAGADPGSPRRLDRSFSLSSGYLERISNSNEGLVYFPLSAIQLYSQGFDSVTQGQLKSQSQRALIALLEFPVSYWLAHSLFIPFHEFGHARANVAANLRDYDYSSQGWGSTIIGVGSYWSLSLLRLITPPFGFPGSGHAETRYLGVAPSRFTVGLSQYYGSSADDLIRTASGLNNQMFLAKKISDLVYEKNGHITYFAHYLGNKISGFVYSQMDQDGLNNDPYVNGSSDISSILAYYSQRGLRVTHADLQRQSLVSLMSGSTFAFLKGYVQYIQTGRPEVYPLEFFGFRVPDVNAYINARGLSYELVTGYRFHPHFRLDLAYERVWKGEFAQQWTPRFHYQLASLFPRLNDFWVSTDLVIGKGIGGSLQVQWTPYLFHFDRFSTRLSYFSRLIFYNAYTLYGERNTPSFDQRVVTPEWIVGLNYKF